MCEQKKNGLVEKTYEQLFLLTTAAKIDQRWIWTNEKKKKKGLADKTYEQRFLFTSIEAFVFQKIKRRRRRRN